MSSWKKKPIEKKKAPEPSKVSLEQPDAQNDLSQMDIDNIIDSNDEAVKSSQDNPDPSAFEDLKANQTAFGRNIQADYREHPKFSKFKKGKA